MSSLQVFARVLRRRAQLALCDVCAISSLTRSCSCQTVHMSNPSDLRRLAGGGNRGKSTNYDAMGTPVSGCGVPPDMYGDRLWVALNSGRDDGGMGMFEDGANCGRWIEIRLGKNCIMDCEHDDVPEDSARPPTFAACFDLLSACAQVSFCCFS